MDMNEAFTRQDLGLPVTKQEARAWIRHIRDDLRDAEKALRLYTQPEDWQPIVTAAMEDAGGSAATFQNRLMEVTR